MTIIVSQTGAADWTLTAQEICRDALEHLTVVGANDAVDAVDYNKALRALDSVLKAMPLIGYTWPKLSVDVALSWSADTPQTISLPVDYFNYPVVHITQNGEQVRLTQIPHSQWVSMLDREETAEYPTGFYISPDDQIYFWPVPTQDPVATLQYQRVIDDSVAADTPDMPQYWLNPLGWGVADEMSMDYGINPQDRAEIRQRWLTKSALALESSISYEPIIISVDG